MDKFIKYYKKEKEILTNKINEFNNRRQQTYKR